MQHLDRTLAEPHHLLALPGGVSAEDVEALAVARHEDAGGAGEAAIQLQAGAQLTGPWALDAGLRGALDLPGWAEEAYLLRCPVQRGGALPPELEGIDPLLDAFVEGVPVGTEREALDHLRALARRLGGAVRLAGSGTVVVPDPETAVDLTVLAPVWLEHDAARAVLEAAGLPGLRSLLDEIPEELSREQVLESYAFVCEADGGDLVEIAANGLPVPPTVLRDAAWAQDGVIAYEVRWRPREPEAAFALRPTPAVRQARQRAARLIERAALALHPVTEGEICDDDGFLVDPADLHP